MLMAGVLPSRGRTWWVPGLDEFTCRQHCDGSRPRADRLLIKPGQADQAGVGSKRRLSRILATALAVCLALDPSLELPTPAWSACPGLIRSLSALGRDPSQCCRQVNSSRRGTDRVRPLDGRTTAMSMLANEYLSLIHI